MLYPVTIHHSQFSVFIFLLLSIRYITLNDDVKVYHMEKSMEERITIDPDICHGKPSIRGLRYPVELILQLLGSGMSLEDYPDLEQDDILAALRYPKSRNRIV